MRFRIHFTKNGVKYSFIAQGADVDAVRDAVKSGLAKRGVQDANCWSEELKDSERNTSRKS